METISEVRKSISIAYPKIIEECRSVLGSELHYQAMTYHLLRTFGEIPLKQIGMNVKTLIENCQTDFFKKEIKKKHINYQSYGLEIIPDISIYNSDIKGDWRRRNYKNTLKQTLYSLEIKASERHKSRLQFSEIKKDLLKLKSQFDETYLKLNKKIGIGMMIIDTAPIKKERMSNETLEKIINLSNELSIDLWYFTKNKQIELLYP